MCVIYICVCCYTNKTFVILSVFFEIPNVMIYSDFQNQVTYICDWACKNWVAISALITIIITGV